MNWERSHGWAVEFRFRPDTHWAIWPLSYAATKREALELFGAMKRWARKEFWSRNGMRDGEGHRAVRVKIVKAECG